jgi:nucleoside-diphosphate-sugar epimerase
MGLVRQIAWESTWIDRVRKGKPIAICGDGNALHQYLYVDDAAPAFCHVLGRGRCLGQVYNMTRRGYITWTDYHRTAMKVIGREVELVGIPMADLKQAQVPGYSICEDIFGNHCYYNSEKLFRDVPEFGPKVSLEDGIGRVLQALDAAGRIPNSDDENWEDELIARRRAAFGG